MPIFSIYLNIYTLCFILISRSSFAAPDYRYEACGPRNCGKGPNISFPFYIKGLQNSYCGFPGFMLSCSHGFPLLQLLQNEYIVENISYQTQSLRVYDSAVLAADKNGCVSGIRNTSLPTAQFDFAENATKLLLFSNCSDSSSKDNRTIFCDGGGRILPLYEGDESAVADAVKNCEANSVAAAVEEVDGGLGSTVSVEQVLRRGFVVRWKASDCSKCENSGGRCGFNETTYMFRCFCPNRPRYRACTSEKEGSTLILAAALFGGGVFLLVCLLISFFLIWRCKKRLKNASNPSKSDVQYFGTQIFSYKELMESTNFFDSSKEIGDGGYGTVYYGKLCDGREVAIKRLHEHNYRRMEQFMNEIKILTCLRHKNLVSLYGCAAATCKDLLLVYEYVANGTVADHLHGDRAATSPLAWPTRLRIAIETAQALAYLHKSDIIHRDVKTSNILLDANFCVKVADFGLSRMIISSSSVDDAADHVVVSTAPQGTPGYVDPSYHRSYHLSSKSDVYSFGVVLVELVSSRPAVDMSRRSEEINLASLAVSRIERGEFDELIDRSLVGFEGDVVRMATLVAELAFRCLQFEKEMRPSMEEVLSGLREICGGYEFEFQTRNGGGDGGGVASIERDDVVVVKEREFESSPNGVADLWVSSSTTTRSSCHESVQI